jgi:hypothetical protein
MCYFPIQKASKQSVQYATVQVMCYHSAAGPIPQLPCRGRTILTRFHSQTISSIGKQYLNSLAATFIERSRSIPGIRYMQPHPSVECTQQTPTIMSKHSSPARATDGDHRLLDSDEVTPESNEIFEGMARLIVMDLSSPFCSSILAQLSVNLP